MERVLDIYKRPYSKDYPVVCMDESPKQLIEDGQIPTAMKQGQEARVDYEYVRKGVVNIFVANDPLQGKRFVKVTEFKTKKNGIFAKLGEQWFDEYWINYGSATMVKDGKTTKITRLKDFLEFKSKPDLVKEIVSRKSKRRKAKK